MIHVDFTTPSAVNGGADRLELCGSLAAGGGVTPSLGLFKAIVRAVPNVPVMVRLVTALGKCGII